MAVRVGPSCLNSHLSHLNGLALLGASGNFAEICVRGCPSLVSRKSRLQSRLPTDSGSAGRRCLFHAQLCWFDEGVLWFVLVFQEYGTCQALERQTIDRGAMRRKVTQRSTGSPEHAWEQARQPRGKRYRENARYHHDLLTSPRTEMIALPQARSGSWRNGVRSWSSYMAEHYSSQEQAMTPW